jgi:hypothetical protein
MAGDEFPSEEEADRRIKARTKAGKIKRRSDLFEPDSVIEQGRQPLSPLQTYIRQFAEDASFGLPSELWSGYKGITDPVPGMSRWDSIDAYDLQYEGELERARAQGGHHELASDLGTLSSFVTPGGIIGGGIKALSKKGLQIASKPARKKAAIEALEQRAKTMGDEVFEGKQSLLREKQALADAEVEILKGGEGLASEGRQLAQGKQSVAKQAEELAKSKQGLSQQEKLLRLREQRKLAGPGADAKMAPPLSKQSVDSPILDPRGKPIKKELMAPNPSATRAQAMNEAYLNKLTGAEAKGLAAKKAEQAGGAASLARSRAAQQGAAARHAESKAAHQGAKAKHAQSRAGLRARAAEQSLSENELRKLTKEILDMRAAQSGGIKLPFGLEKMSRPGSATAMKVEDFISKNVAPRMPDLRRPSKVNSLIE